MEPTELQKEILAVIEPAQREFNEGLTEIREIRKTLASHQERGTAPNDQKVKDLEAKLDELEAKNAERLAQVEEHVRLSLMNGNAPTKGSRDPFEGVFIRDLDAFRAEVAKGQIQRALTSGTTLASAGKLNPEQEDQFLDWLIEKQVALSRATLRRMMSPQAYLDELITAARKLRKATEVTAPTPADAFTTGRRTLTTVETIWAEDVSLSFIEDNIERGGIESHIARNLAIAFGNDHNDLFWNGDEGDSDAFLSINDGIIDIAKADGNVVDYDATSDTKVSELLAGAYRVYPYEFAARGDLASTYFVPYKTALSYADEMTTRGTAFADQVLQNGLPSLRYFGIPVIADPHLTGDEGVLTPASNLVWGVQRGVTLEGEWNARKRAVEYTVTARTDQNYAKSQALVLIDGIAASLR